MTTRRTLLLSCLALAAGGQAIAHHGLMLWDKDKVVTVSGLVSKPMDGYPHWEIEIRVDGQDWVIDLGSDFDMERAGLNPDGSDLPVGTDVTVEGYRPRDSDARLLRPRKITVGKKTFVFTTEWD